MRNNKRSNQVMREARETFIRTRNWKEAELAKTRNYALKIVWGAFLGLFASFGELGNLFNYWRTTSEDRFGELSSAGFAVTLSFAFASFVALAYAIHAGLNWMRGHDENPPSVSITIGLLSLALSIAFPIYQVGGVQDGLLMRCLFSLLLTVVAGCALNHVMSGFDLKDRHIVAGEAITSIDESLEKLADEGGLEGSRRRRMDDLEAKLKEHFAIAFAHEHNHAIDALTLAADSEGLPVAPIEGRVRNLLAGPATSPQVAELVELTSEMTAIGLHRRFAGRSMSIAETSAVRRYLEAVRRPTPGEILRSLNSPMEA